MNALELLKKDHQKVADAMQMLSYNTEETVQNREDIIEKITGDLDLHIKMEEKYLYPLLERHHKSKDMVEHSYEEHQRVIQDLKEINHLNTDDNAWLEKFLELKKDVEHHVKEEEENLFPLIKQVLSEQQLQQLLKDFQHFKEAAKVAA